MRAGFIWLLRLASSRFSKWLGESGRWAVRDRSPGQERTARWDGERIRGSTQRHVWGEWVEYSTLHSVMCVCVCVCSAMRAVVWVTSMNIRVEVKMWNAVRDCVSLPSSCVCVWVHVLTDKYMTATTNYFYYWLICLLFSWLTIVRKYWQRHHSLRQP